MPEPATRQGRAAFRYLRDHPQAGPSEVARMTGCKRDTARTHIRAFHAQSVTDGVRPDVAEAATAAAMAKSATPSPVSPGQSGHRFEEVFPVPKTKPEPKPVPKPAPEPAPADDDDFDLEW